MRRLEGRVRGNEGIDAESLTRVHGEALGESGRAKETSLLLHRPGEYDAVVETVRVDAPERQQKRGRSGAIVHRARGESMRSDAMAFFVARHAEAGSDAAPLELVGIHSEPGAHPIRPLLLRGFSRQEHAGKLGDFAARIFHLNHGRLSFPRGRHGAPSSSKVHFAARGDRFNFVSHLIHVRDKNVCHPVGPHLEPDVAHLVDLRFVARPARHLLENDFPDGCFVAGYSSRLREAFEQARGLALLVTAGGTRAKRRRLRCLDPACVRVRKIGALANRRFQRFRFRDRDALDECSGVLHGGSEPLHRSDARTA